MSSDDEVTLALGRYRAPWLNLIGISVVVLVLAVIAGTRLSKDTVFATFYLLAALAILAFAWFVPVTIISRQGVRRAWKFNRFIPWTDVIRVFEPGPGDPDMMIELRSGKRVLLTGVSKDRLPGIVLLARQESVPS